jgi:hypothetical protein
MPRHVLLIHPELPLRRERLQTGWKTLVWRKSFGGVRKFDQQLVRRIQADESILATHCRRKSQTAAVTGRSGITTTGDND